MGALVLTKEMAVVLLLVADDRRGNVRLEFLILFRLGILVGPLL